MKWVDEAIENLKTKRQLLEIPRLKMLAEKLKEIFAKESNVVHMKSPVTVVGDVHGQFYDVLEIFKIGGECPLTNYLFLGDYVDRGYHSIETITLLCLLKLRYPGRIVLLRGNHESRSVTMVYGFYNECIRKYGTADAWKIFTDLFDYLTLSVVIEDRIFCIHGGLSPSLLCIDQLKTLDRFCEIPHEGIIADIMWSDPESDNELFKISARGAGYTYGSDIVKRFLHTNGVDHILRAHQLCMEGYQILFDNKLSTVWSAPNYCYRCGNLASVLEIGEAPSLNRYFNIFDAAPDDLRESESANETKAENQYFL